MLYDALGDVKSVSKDPAADILFPQYRDWGVDRQAAPSFEMEAQIQILVSFAVLHASLRWMDRVSSCMHVIPGCQLMHGLLLGWAGGRGARRGKTKASDEGE